MVDAQTVSIVVASASVIAGIIYYTLQVRHQTKIRQMDLVMRLYSTFTSKEFTEAGLLVGWSEYKDFEDFVRKYGQMRPEKPMWVAVNQVSNFLNEVGMPLHRGFITIELVDELFGYRIAVVWEKMKPLIEGMRKQLDPRVCEWFEYLYNEMQKFQQSGKS
jgi:hypothetical protein